MPVLRAACARVIAGHGICRTVAEGLDQPARRQAVFSHKIIDDRICSTLTKRTITRCLAGRIRIACYCNHPAFQSPTLYARCRLIDLLLGFGRKDRTARLKQHRDRFEDRIVIEAIDSLVSCVCI